MYLANVLNKIWTKIVNSNIRWSWFQNFKRHLIPRYLTLNKVDKK